MRGAYHGRIHMWDHPKGNHYTQAPSPAQGNTHERWTWHLALRHTWLPRVQEELQPGSPRGTKLRSNKSTRIRSVEGNGAASEIDTEQVLVLLAIWGKYTGGHGLYTEIIKSCKHVRCRQASSSTNVCYWGAPRQYPRQSNGSRRVCSHTKGAW